MIEQLKVDLKTAKTYQDLMGENGAIKKIIKASFEGMLDAELTEHLGYEKYSPAGKNTGNSRNGKTHKTLKNDYGEIELTVPRDRNGSFEPVIVKKYEIPLWILSLEDLNTNLITNSFTANENNLLVYSIEYGVTDSVLALVQLQNKFISFRVELIDQLTGVVLAELNNIQMDGNNVEKLKTATFNFNITGLPNSSLVIRLKVNNNLEPQYAAAVIKSDESVLLKNNPVELNLSGTAVITEYSLEQNFPNPFNPSTKIKFQIPKDGFVSLKVYDILGNEITTLVNEEKSRGRYEVNFNGSSLANGAYIYKIQSGDFISSKKMILLK
ncbi:MAG: hypothetical protein BroJett005_20180 [Ignavibacteriota bacterium]|nr:MAG: hypothetical protein BroJett005_20180 [Ignavibacteriota bacterium]